MSKKQSGRKPAAARGKIVKQLAPIDETAVSPPLVPKMMHDLLSSSAAEPAFEEGNPEAMVLVDQELDAAGFRAGKSFFMLEDMDTRESCELVLRNAEEEVNLAMLEADQAMSLCGGEPSLDTCIGLETLHESEQNLYSTDESSEDFRYGFDQI